MERTEYPTDAAAKTLIFTDYQNIYTSANKIQNALNNGHKQEFKGKHSLLRAICNIASSSRKGDTTL